MGGDSYWNHFLGWCEARGESALPAEGAVVAWYLRELRGAGELPAMIRERLAALRDVHLAACHEDPSLDERVLGELERLGAPSDRPEEARAVPLNPSEPTFGAESPGSRERAALAVDLGAPKGDLVVHGSQVDLLAQVPEEEVWLAGQRSDQTRRAYRADVRHFIRTLGVSSSAELYAVTPAAVIQWVRSMEAEDPAPRPKTIRRRLSALSSLYKHLAARHLVETNPVREVERPRVNRRQGNTPSFSRKQARALLDAPSSTTLIGKRDRAILAVGLQVGLRRAEIAHLAVKDFRQNQGFWSLYVLQKGGTEYAVSINPQAEARIRDYLEAAGHAGDLEGPLFRPTRSGAGVTDPRRHLEPASIQNVLRKYVLKLGMGPGFSAHSMRATFITTALDNGAALEDVQRDVGHADPSTTKLYDRRGHNPEKSASFYANY